MNKRQLFCFTHAGGNSTFFNEIEKNLTDFNVIKLEYAGHGIRHKEPFYNDFEDLSNDLYEKIKKYYCNGDYALFGYSMGAIALVEVLRRIIDQNEIKCPVQVFLAAHEPHSKEELIGYKDDELDEWVKSRTISFGAVPEKLINNNSFWRLYLPLYRADYALIGKYQFEKLSLKTSIPATVFYSETDTPRIEMESWKHYFVGDCAFFRYEGTHFFIQEHHEEMAKTIQMRFDGRISNDI